MKAVRIKLISMSPRQWLGVAATAVAAVLFGLGLMTGLNMLLTRPAPGVPPADVEPAPVAAAAGA